MNARQLMIGDILKTVFNQKIVKVKEIKQSCIYTENNGYDYNEIEPIPLTAEILEKNGFVYREAEETCATEAFHLWILVGSIFALDDDSWWRSVKDGELHVEFGGFPLKYVHELQHALRLCGIDKEIEV